MWFSIPPKSGANCTSRCASNGMLSSQDCPSRRGEALDGERCVLRVEEVCEGLECHPRRTPLLLRGCSGDIHNVGVLESRVDQPLLRQTGAGELPNIAHARVATLGFEKRVAVAVDDQRFQHQLAPGPQFIFQATQMGHWI